MLLSGNMSRISDVVKAVLLCMVLMSCGDSAAGPHGRSEVARLSINPRTRICYSVTLQRSLASALNLSFDDQQTLAGTVPFRQSLEKRGIAPNLGGTSRFVPLKAGPPLCDAGALVLTKTITGDPQSGRYSIDGRIQLGSSSVTRQLTRNSSAEWVDDLPSRYVRTAKLLRSIVLDSDRLSAELASALNISER